MTSSGFCARILLLAQPARLPRVDLQDKDDLYILGAAIAARVDVLVTGDKELLDLGRVEDVEILSPRQFWEKLKAELRRRGGRGKPRRSRERGKKNKTDAMRERRTYREKLMNSKDLPRVEEIPKKMEKAWESGTLVIPSPREVERGA